MKRLLALALAFVSWPSPVGPSPPLAAPNRLEVAVERPLGLARTVDDWEPGS